jgi:hypothetical protein
MIRVDLNHICKHLAHCRFKNIRNRLLNLLTLSIQNMKTNLLNKYTIILIKIYNQEFYKF